jgi:SecD/SecF fusion protein
MSDRRRNALILLLVAGLIAASAVVAATQKTFLGLDLQGGVELVYKATPTPRTPVNSASLNSAVSIMRNRVDQLGVAQPSIEVTGSNEITVQLPNVHNVQQAESEVGKTAQLFFYDWEADALTPNGQTVASQELAQNPTAIAISQGTGSEATGSASAGGMPLYQAVKLAADYSKLTGKSPPIGRFNSHLYPEYYAFGAPGSPACQAAGHDYGYVPVSGQWCYLAGPDTGPGVSAQTLLSTGLPQGVSASQAHVLAVPRGLTVLQATPQSFSNQPKISDPSTRFFTLLDRVALTGADINNPQASTDQAGSPDVTFGFNGPGQSEFQKVTGQIAHRGQLVSVGSQRLFQHFATALDTTLITVPQIDYTQYPDGIIGSGGSEITGGFTATTASNLATELRLGALPINLTQISEQQVSATLGKQALNQGLVAGAAGLAIVAIFLLVYYRVLGLIATGGLVAYGLYFYALIKLIPITLTLAGIAGLILTIGVAADANIVIFERVKEEIRAGRSIRQGIITGYRKGLSAIIDANVVTIITAFILFVLATSDVKGFAFTLGVGTIVSLFTAVIATQAILMTVGDTRAIRSPVALGAGRRRRFWRYDFMGASRYFFTMSGVILLVGALAIGARGLNFGIDFTSGTQASFGLVRPASQTQVSSYLSSLGIHNLQVQAIHHDKALGPDAFQIAFNKWPRVASPQQRVSLLNALQKRFGVQRNGADFNYTTVGPSFGSSVAHSAAIAIVISLLVISLYVAIRFEWKFAVPVLIALMHDVLITSGVYALTGRTVSADTVAALLTILGYSLYDTIIVFDRIRENVPRMPRAAFSQIVNRSMSEVLTRSLATTSCTLLPIIALLIFGGSTLRDFAFALLIGVASGAYSSIFIASPVLTHWKERESGYRHRRERIIAEHGFVPAYATAGADVDPDRRRPARAGGRITAPEPEGVSAAEFERMKRDLDIEEMPTGRHTSTLTRRLAHRTEEQVDAPSPQRPARAPRSRRRGAALEPAPQVEPGPGSAPALPEPFAAPADQELAGAPDGDAGEPEADGGWTPAPDIAENEGMAPSPKPKRDPKPRARNRRHGRKR